MMAGWLLYTLLTSLLLVTAGYALEQIARACRAPARAVWIGVIIAAALLSAASLLRRMPEPPTPALAPSGAVLHHDVMLKVGELQGSDASVTLSRARAVRRKLLNDLGPRLHEITALHLDPSRWQRYDALIATICASLALAGLLTVLASYVRLRRMRHTLAASEVDGVSVLLSRHLGPAVVGVLRPRVVVPHWLVTLPADERRTILLHEQQHSAARDPLLVLLGAIAVALQPWNAVLWIAFARLRLAVEADCDARVLRLCRRDARWYGTLLLQVCERALARDHAGRLPLTAFVDSTSHLERRVRRMISQPRVRSLSTMGAFVVGVLCAGIACSIRILSAHEAGAKTSADTPMIGAPVSASYLSGRSSTQEDSEAAFRPTWRTTLPSLVNSQHEEPRAGTMVVAPTLELPMRQVGVAAPDTVPNTFTPETLLVRASNPIGPMRARIFSSGVGGMSYVTVTDTLGRVLPTADTLVVNGPLRLILPRPRFRLELESMSLDLAIISSPKPADDGHGGHFIATLLGRHFTIMREKDGDPAKLTFEVGTVQGRRVP